MELRAIDAGEIDAVVDYANSNIIIFPLALRALRGAADAVAVANRNAANQVPVSNSVLAALPRAEYERLSSGLETVETSLGEVLHEEDAQIQYAYFPLNCVVGLLKKTAGARSIATGIVDHKGVVGTSLVFGPGVSAVRAQVLAAGTAMRIHARHFLDQLRHCPVLRHEVHRSIHVELTQARNMLVCICAHPMEPRVAGLILKISDRSASKDIFLTQEFIASILNMRRESVTEVATSLKSRNLVNYNRGKIQILNRAGLESIAGCCHETNQTQPSTARGNRRSRML